MQWQIRVVMIIYSTLPWVCCCSCRGIIKLHEWNIINYPFFFQDILTSLKEFRPNDAFCIVGWSSLDLYPCAELNFVLGEACFDTGCAVISFGHYADVAKQYAENNVERNQNTWDLQNPNETSCSSGDISCLSTAHNDVCLHWNCTVLHDGVIWRLFKVRQL